MQIIINHKNSTKYSYPQKLIESTIKSYLQDKLSFDTILINVWAVGKDRIRQLNKQYRNIDRATDVLSFTSFPQDNVEVLNLGEIVYCPSVVERQAKKFNQTIEEELVLYLRHSIDHLLDEFKVRRVNAKIVNHNRA